MKMRTPSGVPPEGVFMIVLRFHPVDGVYTSEHERHHHMMESSAVLVARVLCVIRLE